jgi:hypothetical protein
MIDKFVLLTPLIILPILLLFAFVGCAFQTGGLGIPGLQATQATLIYPPNALTSQNVTSLTVSFALLSTVTPFPTPIPSVPPSKTVTPLPNTGFDQIKLDWGPSGPSGLNIMPPWTIQCHVDLASSPPFVTVINNDATKTIQMLQGGSINATFQLLPGPSNSVTLVAL